MLKTVLVTQTGVETAYFPLDSSTPPALHGNSHNQSRLVSYRTREVNFPEQPAALSM